MSSSLSIQEDGHVVRVTLNRPEVRNALDEATLLELADFFSKSPLLEKASVIILRGEGTDFCAGADIRWMRRASDYPPAKNRKDARLLTNALKAIDECPVPVMARVHGGIYGGGLGLIAASDIVIADENSKMRFSECRLGILPSVISIFVLPKIGPSHARPLYLTGEVFNAQRAKEIGLVHEVCSSETLDERVSELINQILLNGPKANRLAKSYLRKLHELPRQKRESFSIETLVKARSSTEAKEGLSAFLEKRSPSWAAYRKQP